MTETIFYGDFVKFNKIVPKYINRSLYNITKKYQGCILTVDQYDENDNGYVCYMAGVKVLTPDNTYFYVPRHILTKVKDEIMFNINDIVMIKPAELLPYYNDTDLDMAINFYKNKHLVVCETPEEDKINGDVYVKYENDHFHIPAKFLELVKSEKEIPNTKTQEAIIESRNLLKNKQEKIDRKIIQISAQMNIPEGGYSTLYALCDDGTVWCKDRHSRTWVKETDIPQD